MPTQPLSPADNRSYVGIGKQSAKGTGVAPTLFAAYVGQITFGHNPAVRPIHDAGGGEVIARQVRDIVQPQIQFGMPLRPSAAAQLAAYFLGADSVAGAADPYTHTITSAIAQVWLSLERNQADEVIERLVDAYLTEMVLNIAKRDSGPESMMVVTAGALNAEYQAGATVESYETLRPFLRSDATWIVDGSAATNVQEATFTFRWVTDEAIMADSVVRNNAVRLHLEADIELVQLFETAAEGDAYRATHYQTPTGTSPGETVYRGDLTVDFKYTDQAADDREFKVEFPTVDWHDATLTENDPETSEAVRLTRTGRMVFNSAGEPVTITAKNADSAAYV